ncbi:aldo/keto reductase [Micromonospora sp. WMMD964]|uniref:aldo/keto reductase n=1 Tax=Micromonospora sp. WMMD964 TaxID=3016091 RepID=UPI002499FF0E|nr:aldo/keto reductase [Micromonospora sp. WMMD964]WFF01257.1 aldo/keto reductase [Micromonospora sp. WMMD964]
MRGPTYPRTRRHGGPVDQLAIAFTVAHPAVTSAIIGPRTLPQLEDLLKGATLTLDDAILDRIDEIVPPGTNRYDPNAAFPPRALTDTAMRRRPLIERAAA